MRSSSDRHAPRHQGQQKADVLELRRARPQQALVPRDWPREAAEAQVRELALDALISIAAAVFVVVVVIWLVT